MKHKMGVAGKWKGGGPGFATRFMDFYDVWSCLKRMRFYAFLGHYAPARDGVAGRWFAPWVRVYADFYEIGTLFFVSLRGQVGGRTGGVGQTKRMDRGR